MYSTWILNRVISSEINEFLHLGTELEIYGKLASVPFCQVRASLFSMSSLRNTCMSSKQNFFVVLWVLVPGTGCMAAFDHVSYIIINAFCWAPGVKDGDQINFAPDPGPPPAVQDAPSLCQKLASSAVLGIPGCVIYSTVDVGLQPQQPSKAHTAHLHCLVGVLTLLSR